MNRVDRAIGTGMTVEAFAVPQQSRHVHFTDKNEIVGRLTSRVAASCLRVTARLDAHNLLRLTGAVWLQRFTVVTIRSHQTKTSAGRYKQTGSCSRLVAVLRRHD